MVRASPYNTSTLILLLFASTLSGSQAQSVRAFTCGATFTPGEDPACTQTVDCASAAGVPCFPGVADPTSFADATASSDLVPVTTGTASAPTGLVMCHAGSFVPGDDPRCTQGFTCPDDGITCFPGMDSGVAVGTMSAAPTDVTDPVGRATTTATTYVKQTRSPTVSPPVFTGGAAADGQRGGRMAALAAAVVGVAAAVM